MQSTTLIPHPSRTDATLHCGASPRPSGEERPASTLLVVGQPNVGKSLIFQLLTGRYATVSNYPGTTVMVASGSSTVEGARWRVVDTPGLNSLQASSEDELVARNLVLQGGSVVLQVADAKNLLRTVVLTLELAEAGLPLVLDLNMIDEARERRMTIHGGRLREALGVPVVPTIATQRWGVERLRAAIPKAARPTIRVVYPSVIEEAASRMVSVLPKDLPGPRMLALLWLAGDRDAMQQLSRRLDRASIEQLTAIAASAQEQSATPLGLVISRARLQCAKRLMGQVMSRAPTQRRPWLQRLGVLAMHPVAGVPILVAVLGVMYVLVGDLAAQRGVDFFEHVLFGRYVTPLLQWLVHRLIPWQGLQAMFIGDYGLFTMALPYAFAIILPIVGMFFICFGLLEDVGYLPRLAVMAHRACRWIGLNGKAVLPLVLGLGCDTMATMTTRILESRRDRILVTLLLALGIPCSAQLGVIVAMLAGRPPMALAIWLGVVLAVLVVVGRLASRLIPGEESPFLYEIPPLRRPALSNILIKTLGRIEWYVKEAVPLFFLGTLALFVLDATGLLGLIERVARPMIVGWLRLPPQATAAFLVGFLRRDFGAAGLFALQRAGALSGVQIVVSLVTITLFVPCIAQYFMMVKERGWRTANTIAVVSFTLAFLIGGVLVRVLSQFHLAL